jgi:hypothetical protein
MGMLETIMKHIMLATLLLTPLVVLPAAQPPLPIVPASNAVVYAPHPHFRWAREADMRIDAVHRIQIARDEKFADIVCDDRFEVVSRFVPVKPLAVGRYWWQVRRGEGEWSPTVPFEVRAPEHVFTVRAGSDAAAVARVLQEVATNCPAQVNFEPGTYTLAPLAGKSLATLTKVHDLVVDGHGAWLVLAGTFLVLNDCQRVTLRNFTVTPDRPGHTLVRVVKKDPATGRLVVRPEPGYDADVPRFFRMEDSGGSFLGCMDAERHGHYIPGAGISARNAAIAPAPDEPGAFAISPVQPATLELCPVGAVAVVTAYHWQWVQMNRSEECTFSGVTVTDLPGAFCGGANNSAKSYLACKVQRRSPRDFFGGHSACGSGRIGEWVEGCEFECLPDDGPAEQSFRQLIKGAEGPDAVLLGGSLANSPVRAGDRVALVNAKGGRGVVATALAVTQAAQAVRVQLDRPLAGLCAAIGHDAARGWQGVYLYCDAQSNEDFVYRHNRHIGGRGHGVKFNGTRALIADNHFENINGNAILPGYTSEVSGHGARDVVVSSNTIVRCGWTPIEVRSTSGLGGNILIRGNRISEIRDAAVAVHGCTDVTILGNEFSSPTAPAKGAWVIGTDSSGIRCESNRFFTATPEIKTNMKAK